MVLRVESRPTVYVGCPVNCLFGMGMQRVDAERLECGEPSPLCVV